MRYHPNSYFLAIAMILFVCLSLTCTKAAFSPHDWVEITVRNVPTDLRQIYLIADRPVGVRALKWYHSKLVVNASDPREAGQEWSRNGAEDQRSASVQWPSAERYGALAQRPDGTWELWWLGPTDLDGPSISRYLVGGGKAEVRLPDESRAVTPSRELLEQVGLPDAPASP